jgi:hypothetical protein
MCDTELDEPGALFIGIPHEDGKAYKRHLCVMCTLDLAMYMWDRKGQIAEAS